MKKLFGVMILAGLPVACGSGLPSTPDAMQNETAADDSSVSSLRKGKGVPTPTCVVGEPEAQIESIQIAVVSRGDGYVRVRAQAQTSDSNHANICFVPTWSTGPLSRGSSFTADQDTQEATLVALSGYYEIVATVDSNNDRRIVGRLTVAIK